MGYIQQSPVIYPMTIVDNMTLSSNRNVTMQEVIKLTKDFELYDDIQALTNKFDTYIDPSFNLSAGQK